jgi:transketolase N-terminal domain/subunit
MPATAHVSDPGTHWTAGDPARLATLIRLRAVRMVAPHGFGYLGQALSSAEQVAALFSVMTPGEDRLVCSPGHYVIGIFAAAAELGLLDEEAVAAYGQDGSHVEAIEPVKAKWEAFGWAAKDIDGHDVAAVIDGLTWAGSAKQPSVLINRTSTARGLRCLPPDADGHFTKLPPELAARAEAELTAELERLHG